MDVLENKRIFNKKMDLVKFPKVMKHVDLVLLYFSGAWCDKCDIFTPKLKKVHETSRRHKFGLEVFYVPQDETIEEMKKHFMTHGEWYMVGYDRLISRELVYTYNITCIPAALVLTNKGKIITRKGVDEIEKLDTNVLITWSGV